MPYWFTHECCGVVWKEEEHVIGEPPFPGNTIAIGVYEHISLEKRQARWFCQLSGDQEIRTAIFMQER